MIPREDYFPAVDRELAGLLSAEGLHLFGVAPAPGAPASGATDTPRLHHRRMQARTEHDAWIAAGHHGEMGYLAKNAHLAYAPGDVLAGCRSVVVVGCNYYQEPRHEIASGTGRVARYAWGRDYHNALGKRLKRVVRTLREHHPGEEFRPFVDASPLSERFFAEHAGVGYTARNTLSISSTCGSWFFLGEILSTVDFPATPLDEPCHGACPSNCFRCGTACPTDALYDHHRIDARRCISYLTIEHPGPIAEELRPLMGDWIFGCDLCQETCPQNVRSRETTLEDFRTHRAGERISLESLLAIEDEQTYRARFAGTPLLRPGREAMVRNASIAAANTGTRELLPRLRELAHDESTLIREHARWAVEQLAKSPPTGRNAPRRCIPPRGRSG